MGSQSNRTGALGEKLALIFFTKKGYRLVAKNYRIRGGEIDLILEKDGILLFAEVKTRKSSAFGSAEESITYKKKTKLLRAISHYLQDCPRKKWQCDLLALRLENGNTVRVHHIPHILNFD